MSSLPDLSAQLVDGNGKLKDAWHDFFQSLVNSQTRANGNIESVTTGKASVQQDFSESILIEYPEDKDYKFIFPGITGTIDAVSAVSSTGTCTVTVLTNGQPLGGGQNSVTTAQSTVTHTAKNELSFTLPLIIRVSDNASCEDLSIALRGTMALD